MTIGHGEPSPPPRPSPLRWLLVLVPLVVIVYAGSLVLGRVPALIEELTRLATAPAAEQEPAQEPEPPAGETRPDLPVPPVSRPEPAPPVPAPRAAFPAAPAPEAPPRETQSPPLFTPDTIIARLDSADVAQGAMLFRMCSVCHGSVKDAAQTIGPNLWGIAGRPKGASSGYNYSQAMKAKGGTWTDADLARYLNNPRGFLPGTSMTFAGLASPAKIANVIAYLHTLSDGSAP